MLPLGRSLIGVVSGILVAIICTLLAGLIQIPPEIAMWLPLLGFLLCCLIIGAVGQLRVFHALIISFLVFLGIMVFLAAIAFLWDAVVFGPLSLGRILTAWTDFLNLLNTFPVFPLFSYFAQLVRSFLPDSMIAIFIEYFIAFLFVAIIGLLVTAISAYFTRPSPLYVATAPEVSTDMPETVFPSTTSPTSEAGTSVQAAQVPPPPGAPPQTGAPPPSMPAPRPVEESIPKGGAPSAKAISTLKGKVKKHLKGTGQKAPAGQTRCPHCNATIIRGSQFCNACQREIK